jgi:hypothetical protein
MEEIIKKNEKVLVIFGELMDETQSIYKKIKYRYQGDIEFVNYTIRENKEMFYRYYISSVPLFRLYIEGELKYEKKGKEGLEEIQKILLSME